MEDRKSRRTPTESPTWPERQDEQLLQDIAEAHDVWQRALEQFNYATGTDTVDDAIYLLIAAERRYEGLLRVARRRGLAVDIHGKPFAANHVASETGQAETDITKRNHSL